MKFLQMKAFITLLALTTVACSSGGSESEAGASPEPEIIYLEEDGFDNNDSPCRYVTDGELPWAIYRGRLFTEYTTPFGSANDGDFLIVPVEAGEEVRVRVRLRGFLPAVTVAGYLGSVQHDYHPSSCFDHVEDFATDPSGGNPYVLFNDTYDAEYFHTVADPSYAVFEHLEGEQLYLQVYLYASSLNFGQSVNWEVEIERL